jgi:O-acetyl-ADP-ribose deacetylase (regulator of RNase III)
VARRKRNQNLARKKSLLVQHNVAFIAHCGLCEKLLYVFSVIKMFHIHFVDFGRDFIEEIQRLFQGHPNVSCSCQDVKTLPIENTAFVSPANAIGFMDGGIDYVYSRIMFHGVEKNVKHHIKMLNLRTALGRYMLPIGSALIVKTGETTCLISAPTMFLPHDVSQTKNAYHAFMASLLMFQKYTTRVPDSRLNTMVCPAFCTGYGNMPVSEAAKQMYDAYNDFVSGNVPNEESHTELDWCYIAESRNEEQPNNFDNREIKIIEIKDLL